MQSARLDLALLAVGLDQVRHMHCVRNDFLFARQNQSQWLRWKGESQIVSPTDIEGIHKIRLPRGCNHPRKRSLGSAIVLAFQVLIQLDRARFCCGFPYAYSRMGVRANAKWAEGASSA